MLTGVCADDPWAFWEDTDNEIFKEDQKEAEPFLRSAIVASTRDHFHGVKKEEEVEAPTKWRFVQITPIHNFAFCAHFIWVLVNKAFECVRMNL